MRAVTWSVPGEKVKLRAGLRGLRKHFSDRRWQDLAAECKFGFVCERKRRMNSLVSTGIVFEQAISPLIHVDQEGMAERTGAARCSAFTA